MSEQIERHAALGFYHLAEDFYRSAILCEQAMAAKTVRLHYSHVPYHLHTHSIELALKAYLRAKNISVKELRDKYRHGLTGILDKCIELKMKAGKPKRTEQVVRWLDELARTQTFRYFEGEAHTLPALPDVAQANERILKAVRAACVKSMVR